MSSSIKTRRIYERIPVYLDRLFKAYEYPWEIISKIKDVCESLTMEGLSGYKEIEKGILIGENVTISSTATIVSPTIIGSKTEIRTGAYIRGNVIIGEGCVIGNSTELKNCILLDKVQVPHYNYVGDSILGYKAHLGAGSICSNLKSGGGNVNIRDGEKIYETGLRKVGAFLGDCVDVGCNCVLNPGTIIGKGTRVYPLTSLRGVYPEGCIIKGTRVVERKL